MIKWSVIDGLTETKRVELNLLAAHKHLPINSAAVELKNKCSSKTTETETEKNELNSCLFKQQQQVATS